MCTSLSHVRKGGREGRGEMGEPGAAVERAKVQKGGQPKWLDYTEKSLCGKGSPGWDCGMLGGPGGQVHFDKLVTSATCPRV